MEHGPKPTSVEQTSGDLGGELGNFLKERNPELVDKFKELLPVLGKGILEFLQQKFPDQEEGMLRGFVAGVEGISQDQVEYANLDELRTKVSSAIEGLLASKE